MSDGGDSVFYLFCVARSDSIRNLDGTGIDGHSPLFQLDQGGITAVMSAASPSEFCGEAAEARMQDLSWLGWRACRHEEVIERIAAQSPVLPARYGTLFTSKENVEKLLNKHHRAISDFLDGVGGRGEWAVKAMLHRV